MRVGSCPEIEKHILTQLHIRRPGQKAQSMSLVDNGCMREAYFAQTRAWSGEAELSVLVASAFLITTPLNASPRLERRRSERTQTTTILT